MTEAAKKITNLRPPEQDFLQNEGIEPWMRQKNEPAEWYMRFKRYLDMGSKRSLRAVVASESGTQVNTKEGKKLSDVSVPRAWRRASKLWRWVERVEAYDLAQLEKQAIRIREMAATAPHSSRAYRILKLDYMGRVLRSWMPDGAIELDRIKDYVALIARYQSVMRDIAAEMDGLDGVTLELCDAFAMYHTRVEAVEQQYAEKLRNAPTYQRDKIKLDRADALAKIEKYRP